VDNVTLGVVAVGHFGIRIVGLAPIGGSFRAIGVFNIIGVMRFEWLIFVDLGLIRLVSAKTLADEIQNC